MSRRAALQGSELAGDSRRGLSVVGKARLAAEILVVYTRARWWLRRRGLEETVAAMRGGDTAGDAPSEAQLRTGRRLGWIVGKTLGVLPADSRCLVRSLVLTSLLARRGIASRLVIGVTSDPEFEGHAWVECAGVPVLPAGEAAHGRLVEL
jgi:hypothetical protein